MLVNHTIATAIPAKADARTPQGTSIYEKIGWKGLLNVVWKSTPYPLRLIGLPYSFCIYGSYLRRSRTIEDLLSLHSEKYTHSIVFRFLRPRYHDAKSLLLSYGVRPYARIAQIAAKPNAANPAAARAQA
jgi:hypothetical protein